MFSKAFRFVILHICRIFIFVIVFVIVLLLYKTKSSSVTNRQNEINSSEIFNFIQLANKEDIITNSDAFGPIAEDTMILAVMLDNFSSGFNLMISSLAQVSGIEEVLLIFSHSFFDEEFNKVIRSIDFCRVLQIYYPYSIQTHPKEFPGYDPNDCPYENSKYAKFNCTGSSFPDVRGRFRNPPYAEKKHHWWWTANFIFQNFWSTAKHTGLVIFLEDNIIFMKDFIYMASYMKNIANSLPQCELLSLGSDTTPAEPQIIKTSDIYSVKLSTWSLKEHSRLLAFDMSVWNSVVSHYDMFCTFDDASWLRSLNFVSVHRKDGKSFKAMSAVTPRAFKIDRCSPEFSGFFNSPCDSSKNILTARKIDEWNDENWFPILLELYINVELEDEDIIFDYSEGNGGWADPRDQELCHNMTAGKIKKILMDMKNEFN